MEAVHQSPMQWVHVRDGIFPALAPVLLVSVGYIDPGKWVSCIDSGARFGGDLTAFLLAFNFVAIICHYLSAHISVICGKNLAQICREQFDKRTCIFLAVQAELSMTLLDLTMIFGIANGLHTILGVDLFSSVLLTVLNAVIYLVLSTLLEKSKAYTAIICTAAITFVSYVVGILFSQPEISVSPIVLPSKLRGESIYALMSLLGANVMPHNFYLHSSIVQRLHGSLGASKGRWSHNNIFIIVAIFSSIFIVNYALMNSAANVFYNTGLVLLTFQDAMSLMEQVLKSNVGSICLFLLIFLSNQITNLSWEIGREGGQAILYDFFEIDLPWWLHCATIRIFAIIPALYCIWFSGAEGMYQMLIFSQVIMALLLPTSVFPLYRIASCGSLMGVNKVSSVTEFLVLLCFMGMVALKVIFLVEMAFGESDWADYLNWNMGTGSSAPYVILMLIGCIWLCFTLRLLSTPLKCMHPRQDVQTRNWEMPSNEPESYIEREEGDITDHKYYGEPISKRPEEIPYSEKPLGGMSSSAQNAEFNLPDTIMDAEPETSLPPIEENSCIKEPLVSSIGHLQQPVKQIPMVNAAHEASDNKSFKSIGLKDEAPDLVGKTCRIEDKVIVQKDDEERENWDIDESSKEASTLSPPMGLDGLGSGLPRSFSGKTDEGGNGAGSLSRLSGLGRAARRQLAAVLDEFWGQLFDFHGNFTQDAKGKKMDLLLGVEISKPQQTSSVKVDPSAVKDFGGGVLAQSIHGVGPASLMGSSAPYEAQNLQRLQSSSAGSPYGVRQGTTPSSWADEMHVMDEYLQGSSGMTLDSMERRYSSLRLPSSSDGYSYQPATLHGYQFPSYLNRAAKDRFDYPNSQREYSSMRSPSMRSSNSLREPPGFSQGQKTMNRFNSVKSPSTGQNNTSLGNTTLPSDQLNTYDLFSPRVTENNMVNQINAKKYHSSPDISGLSLPLKELYLSEKYSQWGNNPSISTGYGPSMSRSTLEQTLYRNIASRVGAINMGFDDVSSSPKPYRESFPSRLDSGPSSGSLWHKQPFEQFGVANSASMSPGTEGSVSNSGLVDSGESTSRLTWADVDVKLLLSLRHCILKLLKLEGSEWLFRQNDGADEELIDRVAVRERFIYEAELQDMKQMMNVNEYSQYSTSVPQCGEGCVWKVDLIASFGVWCIHRVLELSLMESRPELWGKYTYVLNRLQGIIEPAFFKPRSPKSPCFCLQIPASYQHRLSPVSNGSLLPPAAKLPRGKFTTAPMLLELIKDVETAINSRKGKSGTAAGDVAFPKGKENLASVLKRYKRRLSNKNEGASGRKGPGRS